MQQSDAHSTWQIVIDHVSLIPDLHFIFFYPQGNSSAVLTGILQFSSILLHKKCHRRQTKFVTK